MKTILTIGTFDLLHPGHLELLEESAKFGRLFVGVNTDAFVLRYKARTPTQSLGHRIEVLRAIKWVDAVFVNIGDEYSGWLIDAVRPDLLTIGEDWYDPIGEERYMKQLGVNKKWLEARNLRVQYIKRTRGVSTTKLRDSGAGSGPVNGI